MVASSLVQLFTDCVSSLHASFKGRKCGGACLLCLPLHCHGRERSRQEAGLLQSLAGGFPSHRDDLLNIAYCQLYSGTSLLVSITTGLICTLTQ